MMKKFMNLFCLLILIGSVQQISATTNPSSVEVLTNQYPPYTQSIKEAPANTIPTIVKPNNFVIWKEQPITPVTTRAYDRDGTIVKVNSTSSFFDSQFTYTIGKDKVTITGTPTTTGNGMLFLIATDNDGGIGTSYNFMFNILDAKGETIFKKLNETATAQEVLDKAEVLDNVSNITITRTILDPIPTYQDIKNGKSNAVSVELATPTGEKKIITVTIEYPPICVKPANTVGTTLNTAGTALNTIVGITDLGRAEGNGNLNDDTSWPMLREDGWIALESNNKGLVITRMTTAQITAISTPQEGMIVYDTNEKYIKIYNDTAWKCFSTPTCLTF